LAEREGKRCDYVALQDGRKEYCIATRDRIPWLWTLNPHASRRAAGHPFALVGSFLATKGTLGGAYFSIFPPMGMPATMVAPTRSPPMVQRKPLSYKTYKEASDPNAYTRYFEKCIWHNGETNEVVIINLFGDHLD
jgi:hypothetical protein